ncbi:hypothetical protein INS49_007782 [Diaporthe citri]|uniref:uncharacterized protein n=1 Tax=Diaporthe citri TaxID=83186 RepID=UPI001C8182AD|nr:uncharacterized protein INS49_007782 [Diaporthe citri]KAG6362689.1 hypothetical protein INS49_007782 [Diaporthe citri]
MAEDVSTLDQAMDIDADVPRVPSTGSTSVATSRSPLRARRNLPNENDKRRNNQVDDSLKPRPDAKVHKSSSNANTTRHNPSYLEKQKRKMMMINVQRNRKLRIQNAIANGTFQIRPLGYDSVEADQGEPQQLERLNKDLVTQALYSPVPGMAFDPTMTSFSEADMGDLVQALEAFQMHLARKGTIVLSDRAGPLLRSFARDVLAIVLLQPDKPGWNISVDDFWARVALDYQQSKKLKWLTLRVMKLLEPAEEDTAPKRGKGPPFAARMNVVLDALKAPGKVPVLDKAIAEASEDIPPFIVAQPSTLRCLMGHFEAARSRYLANLNNSLGTGSQSNLGPHKPTPGFSMPPRNQDQYASSEDEDDDFQGGMLDGGVEDNTQVEEGVPSSHTQWFLVKLDNWMASKNGQQQGGVDVDMLSALDLVDAN